jgi:hypothetical protein
LEEEFPERDENDCSSEPDPIDQRSTHEYFQFFQRDHRLVDHDRRDLQLVDDCC